MKRTRQNVLLLLAVSCSCAFGSVRERYVDTSDGKYLLRSQPEEAAGLLPDLSLVVTSLLNVAAVSRVSEEDSRQVAKLIKSSPFDKPEAVAVLAVAGADSGDLWSQLEAGVSFTGPNERSAAESLAHLGAVRGIESTELTVESLPGCGEVCLETMLQEALSELKLEANYTPNPSAALQGKLMLRQASFGHAEACVLDLAQKPDRVFAIELVSTWKAAANAAADRRSRLAQGITQLKPHLIERTLLAPQALSEAYGRGSAQHQAALWTAQRLFDYVIRQLRAAFADRIVFALVSFEELSGRDLAAVSDVRLKARPSARSLLAAGDTKAKTNDFIAWISQWCTFFLLLYFSLAGCQCLRKMRFKQDSLLYGKSKAD